MTEQTSLFCPNGISCVQMVHTTSITGGEFDEKPNNHVRRLRLQTSQRKGMYLQTVKDYRNALQGLRNGSLLQKLRREVIDCALCVAQWKLHRHLSGDCLCDSRFCFFFVKCASKKI